MKQENRGGHNRKQLDEEKVIETYLDNWSLRKTALDFDCSTPTIRKVLTKHNVEVTRKAKYSEEYREMRSNQLKKQHESGMFSGENHSQWKGGKTVVDCSYCGKETERWPCLTKDVLFYSCSKNCWSELYSNFFSGEDSPQWKGGRMNFNGYVAVYCPEHPRTHLNHIFEHIIVAEEALGRFLKEGEVIHHINEQRDDNRLENLYLFDNNGEHISHHNNVRWGNKSPDLKSNLIKDRRLLNK